MNLCKWEVYKYDGGVLVYHRTFEGDDNTYTSECDVLRDELGMGEYDDMRDYCIIVNVSGGRNT